MNYVDWQLNVHPDLMAALDSEAFPVAVRRKLSMDLRRLMLDGRTGKVKATRGTANADWLRSPLGGNSGNHYYLWWRRAGVTADGGRQIVARAVRHHDDHQPLSLNESELITLQPSALMGHPDRDAGLQTPWNDEQLTFFRSDAQVQILQGSPGTGKTSLIQESIQQLRGRVLYLTQSRPLLEDADRYLQLFARGADVKLMTLREWMGALLDTEAPQFSQYVDFRDAIERIPQKRLGVWSEDRYGLWCEIYGHIGGRYGSWLRNGKWEVEQQRHWESERAGELGESANVGVAKVIATLSQSHDELKVLFPELYAAARLQELLTRERAMSLGSFDLIVVDEVQDLTQVDLANVTAFAAFALRESDRAAHQLIVAGDEAQTIRPTDFRFGTAKRIVGEHFPTNQHTELTTNMRCPPRVAKLVNRAWDLYGSLNRRERPRGDANVRVDENVEDTIHLVLVPDAAQLNTLISEMARREYTVVSAAPVTHGELSANPDVRTVDDVKGRDLSLVALVGAQDLLRSLYQGANPDKWQVHKQRQSIDRLRVALSRATEQLVFLELASNVTDVEVLMQLLAPVAPHVCTPESFMSTLGDVDMTNYLDTFLLDVRQKAESNPTTAWYTLQHTIRTHAEHERAGESLAEVGARIHDAHTQYAAEFATVQRKAWRDDAVDIHALLRKAAELEALLGKRPKMATWLAAAAEARQADASNLATLWPAMEKARQAAMPVTGWRKRVEQALRNEFRDELLPSLIDNARPSDTSSILAMLQDGEIAQWMYGNDHRRHDAMLSDWAGRFEARKAWSEAIRIYGSMRHPPAAKLGYCAEQIRRWDEALGHYARLQDMDGQVRMLRALNRSIEARELLQDRAASVARSSREVFEFFDRINEFMKDIPRGVIWQARQSVSVSESGRQWVAIRPLYKAAFQKDPSFDVHDSIMALYFWAGFTKPPGVQRLPAWLGADFSAFLADAFAYPFEKSKRRTNDLTAGLKTILESVDQQQRTDDDPPKLPHVVCRAALVYCLAQFSVNSASEEFTSHDSGEFWKHATRLARHLYLPFPVTRMPEVVEEFPSADDQSIRNDSEYLQHVLLHGAEWMEETRLLQSPNFRLLHHLGAWPILAKRALQLGDYTHTSAYLRKYAEVSDWAAALKAYCDRADVQGVTLRLYDAERDRLKRLLEPLMDELSGRRILHSRKNLSPEWTEFNTWLAYKPTKVAIDPDNRNLGGMVEMSEADKAMIAKAGAKQKTNRGGFQNGELPGSRRGRR